MQISNGGGNILKKLNEHKSFPILDHPDQSVTTPKIADAAVTTEKIATGALDGRYYTEAEVDAKLAENKNGDHAGTWQGFEATYFLTPGNFTFYTYQHHYTKAEIDATNRDHKGTWQGNQPSAFYTKTQLDAGSLDGRYYTESEVDSKLSANASGNHAGAWQGNQPSAFYTKAEIDAGSLDGRYYTEAEVDTKLSANASGNHTGTWQGNQPTAFYTKAQLDAGALDDRYYTETEIDGATRDHKGTWRGYTPEQLAGGGGGAPTIQGVFHVKDYANLAVNVGQATEDWQPAIQACIDAAAASRTVTTVAANNVAKIVFELKRYKIRNPLMLPPQGITLEGVGISGFMPDNEYSYGFGANDINCTVIEKTTSTNTTYASKTRPARDGTITTNFSGDACIMIDHPDRGWNYNTTIRNLYLRSRTGTGTGIFAPRCAHLTIENVMMYKFATGFHTYDTWMSNLYRVIARDTTIAGFKWEYDAKGASGTTVHFRNCFAENVLSGYGYDINVLHYSVMTTCAADHIGTNATTTAIAYKVTGCDGFTMNGCGAEDIRANSDIVQIDSNTLITVNGFSTYAIAAGTTGSHSQLNIGNGVRAVFNACKFANLAASDTSFSKQYIIGANSSVELHSCTIPSNAGTGTVQTGSVIHTWDLTGYKQITSAGTKTAQMV